MYQGFAHKYDNVRRELKPLLVDPNVTDEAILKQTNRKMSDEKERQRRLGPVTRHKPKSVNSAQVEASAAQSLSVKEENGEKKPKMDVIRELTEKVTTTKPVVASNVPEQEREENNAESENIPHASRLSPGSETEQQSDGSLIDLQGREEEDVVNEDSGLDLENNVLSCCVDPDRTQKVHM